MRIILAYLDPGSASIVFQAVIAGIIAIPVLFRNKIMALFKGGRGASTSEAQDTVAEPTSTTDTPAR